MWKRPEPPKPTFKEKFIKCFCCVPDDKKRMRRRLDMFSRGKADRLVVSESLCKKIYTGILSIAVICAAIYMMIEYMKRINSVVVW